MSFSTQQAAIANHYATNTGLAATVIDWQMFNGPPYRPTDATTIWARPELVPVTGSERPFGIGDGDTYREGLLRIHLFARAGTGESALNAEVDSTVSLFHRLTSLTNIDFRDAYEPERVPEPEPAEWVHTVCTFPYYVIYEV